MVFRLKTHRSVHFITLSYVTTHHRYTPDDSIHAQALFKPAIHSPNHERSLKEW